MGNQDDSLDGLKRRVKDLERCLCEFRKDINEIEQEEGSGIQSIVEGDNISVDNTDPLNPIISSTNDVGYLVYTALFFVILLFFTQNQFEDCI